MHTRTQNDTRNHWPDLYHFLRRRATNPWNHPSFLFYFVVAVVGFGGVGVWRTLLVDSSATALSSNLLTYFPAVAAASAFDIVLNRDEPKFCRSLAVVVGALLLLACILMHVWGYTCRSSVLGVVATLVAWALWWVSNAENKNLQDTPPPEAAIGGRVDQHTQGGMGELQG